MTKGYSVVGRIKCFESNAFNANTTICICMQTHTMNLCSNFASFRFREIYSEWVVQLGVFLLFLQHFCSAFESHYFRALSFFLAFWVGGLNKSFWFLSRSRSQRRRVHWAKMVKKRIKTQREKKKWFIRSLVLWISWLPLILVSFCVCVLKIVRTKTHDDDDETRQKKNAHVK